MDARAQRSKGLRKASPLDGMGRARMDVGVSAHQLVVSVAGVDHFGDRAVGRRSDHAPLRKGRQENCRAAAAHAAGGQRVSRQRFNAIVGSFARMADRDLLLPAVVRKPRGRMGRCRRRDRRARDAGQILFGVSHRELPRRGDLSSAAARLFRLAGPLDFHGHGIGRARTAYGLAGDDRCAAVRLCA